MDITRNNPQTRPAMHGTQLRSLRAFYAEALEHLIASNGCAVWDYIHRLSLLANIRPTAPAGIQEVINEIAYLQLDTDSDGLAQATATLADKARTAVEFASGTEILAIDFKRFTTALKAEAVPAPGVYLTMLQANAAAALDPTATTTAPSYNIPEDAEVEIWVM